MEQVVSPLTASDEKRLNEQRAVVAQLISDVSRKNYGTAAGKLGALRMILENKIFKKEDTYQLQCMGIVLGDAFVQDMGFSWVMVEDENGRDPAIKYPNTSIILFPLTMISKRVERGESVDVFDLYNGIAANVEKMKKEGY